MHTTLNQIRAQGPCRESWEKGLRLLGKTSPDDEPIRIIDILDNLGLDDAIWCLRAVEGRDRDLRLLAVAFASEVKHLMRDLRSHKVLEVATAFANGEASEAELAVARRDAYAAAAGIVGVAGYAAAYADFSAASAAASTAATSAADIAYDAATYATRASPAADAMRTRQADLLRTRQADLLRAACANG